MSAFVPLFLLFGFLTVFARKGEDFSALFALVLVVMSVPTFIVAWRRKAAPCAAMLVLGFCAWAFAAQFGVRAYAGPAAWGGSLALAAAWAAVALGAASIALRAAARYRRGRLFVVSTTAALIVLAGFALSPPLFALGITSYAGRGLYYGVPLAQHVFWLASGLAAGALAAWQYDDETALPPSVLTGGMYVLAFLTGVATGEQLWIPALLGLVLVQYHFHLSRSL